MDNETSTQSTSEATPVSDIVMFKSGGATTGEKVATPAAERDDSGRFKGKEEVVPEAKTEVVAEKATPEVTPEAKVEVKQEKPQGQLAALMAERAKRQELERKLQALEQGASTTPDIFTEPEKAVKALVDQQVAPLKLRFFNRSIEDAVKSHADFTDAYKNFENLLDAHPALLAELQAADDPGEYIYQVGSNTPQFREARDAKHRDELTARDTEIAALKAKLATIEGTQKARQEVPESLNRLPSGAVPARDSDKTDINQIVRFKSG